MKVSRAHSRQNSWSQEGDKQTRDSTCRQRSGWPWPPPWLTQWEWEALGWGLGDEATERQDQHSGLMSRKGVV